MEGGVLSRFELLLKRIAEYPFARNAAWVTLGDLGYDCEKMLSFRVTRPARNELFYIWCREN